MACDIKIGSNGKNVIVLQNFLKSVTYGGGHPYYSGKIDGEYGPMTEGSADSKRLNYGGVMLWQKHHGLVADGYAGPITTAKMGLNCTTTQSISKPSEWVAVPSYKQDKQDTGYTCGPSSMQMALSELGITKSESELAKLMGTTKSGTAHSGFFKAMQSIGLKCWDKNFSEVGWAGLADALKDKAVAVIVHGNTAGWPSYWKNSYGHYVYPVAINLVSERIKIADPTKGVIEYSLSEFKKGMDLVSQPSLIYVSK